jgi:lysophospholipase L1-like esterase
MKNILCFGDSNTWGQNCIDFSRYPRNIRWTGILQQCLGKKYHIIEEGLPGRTSNIPSPLNPAKNGIDYLLGVLAKQKSLHLILIMLGTNDAQDKYNRSAYQIAQGIACLGEVCKKHSPSSKVMLIAPPPRVIKQNDLIGEDLLQAVTKTQELISHLKDLSEVLNVYFYDASEVISTSKVDGTHWSAESHILFGRKISEVVSEILP